MKKKNTFTRILTIIGTLLVSLTILTPVFFSILRLLHGGSFLFDFLMPAELFPLALIGGALLVWAALRAHLHQKLIGWSLGLAIASLFGSQLLAVLTGLASGKTEPVGLPWVTVLALLVTYILLLIILIITGIRLSRDLF